MHQGYAFNMTLGEEIRNIIPGLMTGLTLLVVITLIMMTSCLLISILATHMNIWIWGLFILGAMVIGVLVKGAPLIKIFQQSCNSTNSKRDTRIELGLIPQGCQDTLNTDHQTSIV